MRRPGALILGLLAISLAVNFVGAGYLATVGMKGKPPRTVEGTIDIVSSRYPEPVAKAVREKLEAQRRPLKEAIEEMRAARRATRDAISDEPLDEARANAAFTTARSKADAFWSIIHGAIVEAMKGVPADQRAKIERNDD